MMAGRAMDRIRGWTSWPPQDGDYILHLKDVRGMEGQDFAYRLSLHDADPDYRTKRRPGNPNIPKGGSAFVTVTANRVQGYEGPIEINVEGLPAGVTGKSRHHSRRTRLNVVLLIG